MANRLSTRHAAAAVTPRVAAASAWSLVHAAYGDRVRHVQSRAWHVKSSPADTTRLAWENNSWYVGGKKLTLSIRHLVL
jgi:hypothetical protein